MMRMPLTRRPACEHPHVKFMHVLSATSLDPIYRFGGGSYDSLNISEKNIPDYKEDRMLSIREVQEEYSKYVEKYLIDSHPDVIHAHDWLTFEAGMMAKKKHHIPLIAHVHATEFDRSGMRVGNPLIHEIEYEGLMMADKIIAVSEATKRIIYEKYHIPLSKIDVVYNSLDEDYEKSDYRFEKDLYNYANDLKNDGYIVVATVGRFTIQKGLKNLMKAAALAISKNPKLLFVFAGDGEERNELIELAAELGISKNVIFTGFIRGKKLRDIYSIADIFVMSSISEPFGLTALEAAHHGDALILTKQSGISEIIWSAMTYDFWDVKKLADEIVAIAGNPSLMDTLRDDVRAEYQQISWDEVAKKCLSIYNKVAKHKRK